MTVTQRQFDNRNETRTATSEPIYNFDTEGTKSEYERFEAFAGMLVAVPKSEIDELRDKT